MGIVTFALAAARQVSLGAGHESISNKAFVLDVKCSKSGSKNATSLLQCMLACIDSGGDQGRWQQYGICHEWQHQLWLELV